MRIHRMMASLALLMFLIVVGGVDGSARGGDSRLEAGRHVLKLDAAGHTWSYEIQVPRSERPVPLILVLHGAGGSGARYLDHAGWTAKAAAAGFVVVAPDGLPARPDQPENFLSNPRLWNSGQLDANSPRARVDDLAFFDALLADVARRCSIDPKKVFVTGHSNGASMTFRLAAERSERFAAIAPVAGHCWLRDPRPTKALPTLFIVGDSDPLVPLKGGRSTTPWGSRITPPVQTTLDLWSHALGCPAAEPTESVPHAGLKRIDYADGRDGATLTAYIISGQGHGWPGGKGLLPERLLGPNVETLKATDVIWEYFEQVPNRP